MEHDRAYGAMRIARERQLRLHLFDEEHVVALGVQTHRIAIRNRSDEEITEGLAQLVVPILEMLRDVADGLLFGRRPVVVAGRGD